MVPLGECVLLLRAMFPNPHNLEFARDAEVDDHYALDRDVAD